MSLSRASLPEPVKLMFPYRDSELDGCSDRTELSPPTVLERVRTTQ